MKNSNKLNIMLLSSTPPPIGGISSWTMNYLSSIKNIDNEIDLVNTSKIKGYKIGFFSELKRTISIIKSVHKNIKSNPPAPACPETIHPWPDFASRPGWEKHTIMSA